MAISSETRRAGPFNGNGAQQEFPFAFKVFSADQVKVLTAEKPGGKNVELDSTGYSVTLEADQDSNPGGVVTLSAPLPVGSVLAILSAVPYLQPMTLTNRGGFFPTTLNDSADRAVILAQQNAEILSRCVTVDATDTMTPAELKKNLLDAATAASGSATAAQNAASAAQTAQTAAEAARDEAMKAAGSNKDAVLYTAQTLENGQKVQARTNIDALGKAEKAASAASADAVPWTGVTGRPNLATTEDAKAGTDTAKIMTAARVKEAVETFSPKDETAASILEAFAQFNAENGIT